MPGGRTYHSTWIIISSFAPSIEHRIWHKVGRYPRTICWINECIREHNSQQLTINSVVLVPLTLAYSYFPTIPNITLRRWVSCLNYLLSTVYHPGIVAPYPKPFLLVAYSRDWLPMPNVPEAFTISYTDQTITSHKSWGFCWLLYFYFKELKGLKCYEPCCSSAIILTHICLLH